MVKIKILRVERPEHERYVNGIYEAFRMGFGAHVEYCAHVDKDILLPVRVENCELITGETNTKILLVKDGSINMDGLEEWCINHDIKLIVYKDDSCRPEFLYY